MYIDDFLFEFSCMYIFNVVYAEIREDTSYNIWRDKDLIIVFTISDSVSWHGVGASWRWSAVFT